VDALRKTAANSAKVEEIIFQMEGSVPHLGINLSLLPFYEAVVAMCPRLIAVYIASEQSMKVVWVCERWKSRHNELHDAHNTYLAKQSIGSFGRTVPQLAGSERRKRQYAIALIRRIRSPPCRKPQLGRSGQPPVRVNRRLLRK
jgi:hypothetical protein